MKVPRLDMGGAMLLLLALLVRPSWGEDQVWADGSLDKTWSTNAPNWAGGAVWTNGNSAVFAGAEGTLAGETVEVSAEVTVANIAFLTNGYVVADADSDGALTLSGGPSVIQVEGAGTTALVSEVIGGAGFTKTGAGLLQLKGANTYTGVTAVSAGVLRLNALTPAALGAAGAGNETVVADGATLDVFSAWNANVNEDLTITGSGVGGLGALVNLGPTPYYNVGYRNLTLAGDATIGGSQRFDMAGHGTFTGNGHTLTKAGSFEMAVSRAVNGSPIVINAGSYTIQSGGALGATDYPTTLNGGRLQAWGSHTLGERLFLNGGTVSSSGDRINTFKLTGNITLGGNVILRTDLSATNTLELAGVLDGPGGFTREGGGVVTITGNANAYTGPTILNGPLYLGRTNLAAGVLGAGAVTNNNLLYIERAGSFVSSNGFFGGGTTAIRYGADLTVSDSYSSNGTWHVAHGSLTLTNGAVLCVFGEMTIANRQNVNYGTAPIGGLLLTNVLATVNVTDGCELRPKSITFGNGGDLAGGTMTGILNQVGGVVRTTGGSAEDNGIRLGHYPQTRSFYNMMGGTLIVGANYDLGCATDGEGWFNMTGGEVYATRVMVNERDYDGGFGRLTVAGGVLNLGSASGVIPVVSNGIAADRFARYQVTLGGAGGTLRAATNLDVSVSATLVGTGADAITFDTQGWAITMTNTLSGAGGLNKAGLGDLVLSGANTFSGPIRILKGRLIPASAGALPAGGQVLFGVAGDDAGGTLHAQGDFSLSGLNVGVANPEALDTSKHYTVVTCDGELSGLVAGHALPGPWYLYYDWANDRVELRAAVGTAVLLR